MVADGGVEAAVVMGADADEADEAADKDDGADDVDAVGAAAVAAVADATAALVGGSAALISIFLT